MSIKQQIEELKQQIAELESMQEYIEPTMVPVPGRDYRMADAPVTFEEYDCFCEDTGRETPSDDGWGRGKRPVINVSWNDAVAYAEWLSEKTGKSFRLPTEEEWEHACKADCDWGVNGVKEGEANFWHEGSPQKTTEVRSYPANPWGLYDMLGNVWEWTASKWEEK